MTPEIVTRLSAELSSSSACAAEALATSPMSYSSVMHGQKHVRLGREATHEDVPEATQ